MSEMSEMQQLRKSQLGQSCSATSELYRRRGNICDLCLRTDVSKSELIECWNVWSKGLKKSGYDLIDTGTVIHNYERHLKNFDVVYPDIEIVGKSQFNKKNCVKSVRGHIVYNSIVNDLWSWVPDLPPASPNILRNTLDKNIYEKFKKLKVDD